jgi:hypothetical protein
MTEDTAWFAARTVCRLEADGGVLEERITLWSAASAEEAGRMAERDAVRYAAEQGGTDCGLLQVVHLFEEPGHGTEVLSVRRPAAGVGDEAVAELFAAGDG